MRIIKNSQQMRSYSLKQKARGRTVGFVPTMGALHQGHLSLVEAARKGADLVVVSIFVNPLQFGPREDLTRYPKNLGRDKKLLQDRKVDVLFLPTAGDLYPKGFSSFVEVEGLSNKMCGRSRPDHFRGVTTVVAKLFNIVCPDTAFFGQKDFQQLVIIQRMAKDLGLPVKIIGLPIVREPDGLAMSSRNKYLNSRQRKAAAVLYRSLLRAREMVESGERAPRKVLRQVRSIIMAEPLAKLDYALILDPKTLEPVKRIRGRVLTALAANVGRARLIDNLLIQAK